MKMSQWRRVVENMCVFSARLKVLSDRSGDRSAGGKRFIGHLIFDVEFFAHLPLAKMSHTREYQNTEIMTQ